MSVSETWKQIPSGSHVTRMHVYVGESQNPSERHRPKQSRFQPAPTALILNQSVTLRSYVMSPWCRA